MGWACCMWVMPAMGISQIGFGLRARTRRSERARAARISRAASLTNMRKSVATSSLRLRPVCSFQPSGPSSSTSAFSTKWCTSSASEPSSHAVSVCARSSIRSSAASVSAHFVRVKMPAPCSALAHARSTASSYGSKRRSNANDRWNVSNTAFGRAFETPAPQAIVFAFGHSVISNAVKICTA